MKKILVIIKPFIGCENAMSNAVMPLLEKAKEKYEVDVYSLSSANSNKIVENIDGYKVYWHDYLGEGYKKYFRKIKLVLIYIREIDCRIITKRKFIFLIEIIKKILNNINIKLFLKMLNLFEKKPWFNCLEEIVENNAYDAIISISSPIAIQANCLKLIKNKNIKEKNILWIPYYLDPFATYKGNLEKACSHILMNFEEEVYEYADYILTTPEIKKDNLNYTLKKMIVKYFQYNYQI